MPAEQTDAEIVRASLEDPRRFGELFERHWDVLARYLASRAGRAVAEDLASETFAWAFEHRVRFDLGRQSARPWLLGIGTNLLRHHLRRERAQFAALGRAATVAEPPAELDLAAWLDARDTLPVVMRAVGALAPGERDALLLHAWAELSYEEVAEALAIPVGTVRSRLHRARSALRELLAPEEATTGESSERSTDPERDP